MVRVENLIFIPADKQDISAGKTNVCGTLCLDHSGSDMMQRIGNVIYERCRASTLNLPGFPDFAPTIAALKNSSVQERTKSYRVSAQQHDTLLVLEVYAKKWMSTESTKDRAQQVIEAHNAEFNPTEKFWIEERTDCLLTLSTL